MIFLTTFHCVVIFSVVYLVNVLPTWKVSSILGMGGHKRNVTNFESYYWTTRAKGQLRRLSDKLSAEFVNDSVQLLETFSVRLVVCVGVPRNVQTQQQLIVCRKTRTGGLMSVNI